MEPICDASRGVFCAIPEDFGAGLIIRLLLLVVLTAAIVALGSAVEDLFRGGGR